MEKEWYALRKKKKETNLCLETWNVFSEVTFSNFQFFSLRSHRHAQPTMGVPIMCVSLYELSTGGFTEAGFHSCRYISHANWLIASCHGSKSPCFLLRFLEVSLLLNVGCNLWKSTSIFFFWLLQSSASVPANSNWLRKLWALLSETQRFCSFPVTDVSYECCFR